MTTLRATALVLLVLGVVAGMGAGAAAAESVLAAERATGADRTDAAAQVDGAERADGGATLPPLVHGTELLITDARGASLVGYGVVEVAGLTLQLSQSEGTVQVVVVLPGEPPLHVLGEVTGERVYLIAADGLRRDLAEVLAHDERSLTLSFPDGRTVRVEVPEPAAPAERPAVATPDAPGEAPSVAAPARDGPAVDAPVTPPGDDHTPAVPPAARPSVPAAGEADPAEERPANVPVGSPADGPGPPAPPTVPDGVPGDRTDPGDGADRDDEHEDERDDETNGAGGRRPSGRP